MTAERGRGVQDAVLHVVTDDAVLQRPDFVAVAVEILRALGSDVALHLRGPGLSGGRLERWGCRIREGAGDRGWLVVNDRVDVACAIGADGVQLGRRSLDLDDARVVAPDLAMGRSVHGLDLSVLEPVPDWYLLGTIWPSASHPGRPGAGPAAVERWVGASSVPVVAIGGVTAARAREARAAGAAGVAALEGIWSRRDPVAAADAYLSSWSET
jgi:thiamine-phosphate diphosphorylase